MTKTEAIEILLSTDPVNLCAVCIGYGYIDTFGGDLERCPVCLGKNSVIVNELHKEACEVIGLDYEERRIDHLYGKQVSL